MTCMFSLSSFSREEEKEVPLLSQLIGHDLVLKKPARHASVHIGL